MSGNPLAAERANPSWWRMLAINARYWQAVGIWLGAYAVLDFALGWDAYRSNVVAFLLAIASVVVGLSTPRRLIERLGSSTSAEGAMASWWPYLVGVAAFPILVGALDLFGWRSHQVVAAAYVAMGLLATSLVVDDDRSKKLKALQLTE
jgi:hypothetical protein